MKQSIGQGMAKKAIVIGFDGADPMLMKALMAEGKLPNFKKFLEMGATTKDMGMIGVLPTVTPPNWASLATGAYPNTHGITCFWNHTLGNPLGELDNGFSSTQCQAEFIWEAYAKAGKKSIVMNYPTSWPPTALENVTYVDGSKVIALMDAYVDYEKIYHCSATQGAIEVIPHFVDQSGADCFVEGEVDKRKSAVTGGEEVASGGLAEKGAISVDDSNRDKNHADKHDKVFTTIKEAKGWAMDLPAGAKEIILPVNNSQVRNYGLLIPNQDGEYTTMALYLNKKETTPVSTVSVGEWTDFIYDEYLFGENKLKVARKGKLLALALDGSSARFYYNHALNLNINRFCYPAEVGTEIMQHVGPQLFASNASKYNVEGDQLVLDGFASIFAWHAEVLNYLMDTKEWDLVYTHIHPIDLVNHWYINHLHEDARYRDIIAKVYDFADDFIGKMMDRLDGETVIFVTSDHAAIPCDPACGIPSLGDSQGLAAGITAQLGYTVLKEENGALGVDWSQTKAISQRLTNIYINLKGREPEGIVEPEDYDTLVNQIIEDLYNYRDPKTGKRVVSFALRKDQMELVNLDCDHAGDIFFQLQEDFNREHGNGLSDATRDGFSLRCLFMAAGAGIKVNSVIDRKVRIVDIVPTIAHLQGSVIPAHAEGSVVYQLLTQ